MKKIENMMSSILGTSGWQVLGHPNTESGPRVLSHSLFNFRQYFGYRNKMQMDGWPKKIIRCPINVRRINKWLKRGRGKEVKKEGREETKFQCG